MNIFLTLSLDEKRDLLVARQRARQIAGMLHFEKVDQLAIAAGTLAVASQSSAYLGNAQLCFALDNGSLCIFTQGSQEAGLSANRIQDMLPPPKTPHLRLVRALPERARHLSLDDLVFVLEKLPRLPVPKLFDEMVALNQEVLGLLHSLHVCEGQLHEKQIKTGKPSAA